MEPDCDDARLRPEGAICGLDGRLLASAYLDLRSRFAVDQAPGALAAEAPPGLRCWRDIDSEGWIALHPDPGRARCFSVGAWHSWRLCFLLARLQRAVWARPQLEDALPQAARVVLGRLEPLFSTLLGQGEPGLSPSPFDLAALACCCRLLRHLARPLTPRRLARKRRRQGPSPLSLACRALLPRLAKGLQEAVLQGDLDALRFHVEVRGASRQDALWRAVHAGRLELVRFLLGSAQARCPGLLHEALAVWVRGAGNEERAFGVVEALAAAGADLDATIWAEPPAIGSPARPQASRQVSLPFLRRGDPPLAWAMEYHAAAWSGRSCEEQVGPRLRRLVRCLVANGASRERLGRRQRQSLQEILDAGAP